MKDFTPVPDSIMRRRNLMFGARCLFGRLERYAYKTGKCYPSLPRLATELGTSPDSIKRFVTQLKTAGLVRVAKTGLGRGNSTNYVLCSPQEKGVEPPPFKKPPKGSRNAPFSGSEKGCKSAPEKGAKVRSEKGAKPPPKETIVGRNRQGNRQEPRRVKTNGFSPESERRKTDGNYKATMADAEALTRLMFDTTGKTEKVDTALRWLRPARRAEGWYDIETQLRETLAKLATTNRPRNNAWFRTVLVNEFGLSPGDAESQKSEFIERYRKAIALKDPGERVLEAMRCAEEAEKAGISSAVLLASI